MGKSTTLRDINKTAETEANKGTDLAPKTSPLPPTKSKTSNEPAAPVKTGGTNFLQSFQNSVGDKSDPNATSVGIDFGRYLGTLRGTNKGSKDIARATVGGRHAASSALVQTYATQGKEMPAQVATLLDQLDNLASHSAVVAGMDDKVRIQMIGQGNKALDDTVISAQENAILSKLQELTLDVTTAEGRLDFIKKQNETAKSGVELDIKLLKYQTDARNYNQEVIDQKADAILDELTREQIGGMLENGDIPQGVSYIKALTTYQQRVAEESSTRIALATMDKTNVESMERVASTFSVPVLETLVAQGLELVREGDITGSVTIPGTEQTIPVAVLQRALKTQSDNVLATSESDQKRVALNRPSIIGYATALDQMMQQTGTNPNALAVIDARLAVEKAVAASTAEESDDALEKLRKTVTAVHEMHLATLPNDEQKAAAAERFRNGGRNTFQAASASLITKDHTTIQSATAGSQFYQEAGDMYYRFVSGQMEATDEDGEKKIVDIEAIVHGSSGKATPAERVAAMMDDPDNKAIMADAALNQLTEELFVARIDEVFNEVALFSQEESLLTNNAQLSQEMLEIIDQGRRGFFGNTPARPTVFSNVNNPSLVTPREVTRVITDRNGDRQVVPVLNEETGEPVTSAQTDPRVALEQLATLDIALREAGYDGESMTSMFLEGDIGSAVDRVVMRNMPKNGTQEELLVTALPAYREGGSQSADALMANAMTSQFVDFVNESNFNRERFDSIQSLSQAMTTGDINIGLYFGKQRSGYVAQLTKQRIADSGVQESSVDAGRIARQVETEVEGMSIEQLVEAGVINKSDVLAAATATETGN